MQFYALCIVCIDSDKVLEEFSCKLGIFALFFIDFQALCSSADEARNTVEFKGSNWKIGQLWKVHRIG